MGRTQPCQGKNLSASGKLAHADPKIQKHPGYTVPQEMCQHISQLANLPLATWPTPFAPGLYEGAGFARPPEPRYNNIRALV